MFQKFRTFILDHETENPFRLLLIYMGTSIAVWTMQCSLLQNVLGIDIMEAVVWGNQFSWGNSKHPPLSGWLAELFSLLSFRHDWGLYLACQVMLVTGIFFVWKTARLFCDEMTSATGALLLYFLSYYLPSWMKFSTYFVEIALAPMAAYFFFSALEKKKILFWLTFGFVCGLGLLNKYSFALQILGFAILFFAVPKYRKAFFTLGPWFAGVVCLAVFAPHFRWLAQNDFICLRHVQNRMVEEWCWTDPIVVFFAGLYPLLNAAGILFVSWLPDLKRPERKPADRGLFLRTIVLTGVPFTVYVLMECMQQSVIPMWFCSTASWTGLAVLAVFPFKISGRIFSRLFFLLVTVSVIIFAGTSIDLMLRTKKTLHLDPKLFTEKIMEDWKGKSDKPYPSVIFGDQWFCGIIMNTIVSRPPVCDITDEREVNFYKGKIRKEGALLIGRKEDLPRFQKFGIAPDKLQKKKIILSALFGKQKKVVYWIGVLPPENVKKGN